MSSTSDSEEKRQHSHKPESATPSADLDVDRRSPEERNKLLEFADRWCAQDDLKSSRLLTTTTTTTDLPPSAHSHKPHIPQTQGTTIPATDDFAERRRRNGPVSPTMPGDPELYTDVDIWSPEERIRILEWADELSSDEDSIGSPSPPPPTTTITKQTQGITMPSANDFEEKRRRNGPGSPTATEDSDVDRRSPEERNKLLDFADRWCAQDELKSSRLLTTTTTTTDLPPSARSLNPYIPQTQGTTIPATDDFAERKRRNGPVSPTIPGDPDVDSDVDLRSPEERNRLLQWADELSSDEDSIGSPSPPTTTTTQTQGITMLSANNFEKKRRRNGPGSPTTPVDPHVDRRSPEEQHRLLNWAKRYCAQERLESAPPPPTTTTTGDLPSDKATARDSEGT
ncbi:MAG: hypothetical protein M1826_001971 [Phylliscum demangeonii]|nr:MAG: hypothetical protein M1826_001971 [Phylliscum demangeonii]